MELSGSVPAPGAWMLLQRKSPTGSLSGAKRYLPGTASNLSRYFLHKEIKSRATAVPKAINILKYKG